MLEHPADPLTTIREEARTMAAKKCTKCGEEKPLEQFPTWRYGKTGYASWCRVCTNASIREWYYRNKEKRNKQQSEWHARNKEWRNKEALARYYEKPEDWRRRGREWMEKNPERYREIMREADNRRRARKLGAKGVWTEANVKEKFRLQRGKCAACRVNLGKKFHRDHIIALAAGGSNEPTNLQLLCRSCNSRKHKKDPIKFMQENGYLL